MTVWPWLYTGALGYTLFEVIRGIATEAMFQFSLPGGRQALFPLPFVVLCVELVKLGLCFIRKSRQKSLLTKQLLRPRLVLPATLYFINNILYLTALQEAPIQVVTLYLHFRLPATILLQKAIYKKRLVRSLEAWLALVLVILGVAIAEVHAFGLSLSTTFAIVTINALSAMASVSVDLASQEHNLTFWETQESLAVIGSILGLAGTLGAWGSGYSFSASMKNATLRSWICTIGAVISTACVGLHTGLLFQQTDCISKAVFNVASSFPMLVFVHFVFDYFPFGLWNFSTGMVIVGIGMVIYFRQPNHRGNSYKDIAVSLMEMEDKKDDTLNPLSIHDVKCPVTLMTVGVLFLLTWTIFLLIPLPPTASMDQNVDVTLFTDQKLVLITYASSPNPLFCKSVRSILSNNLTLYITGLGQIAAKEMKPYKYTAVAQKVQEQQQGLQGINSPVLVFMDGYDVMVQQNESYILDTFHSFNASIVYSAEKNCWPYVLSATATREMCPQFPVDEAVESLYFPDRPVRWLNSGVMFCKSQACGSFFEESLVTKPKYYTTDDQAIAAETCLKFGQDCQRDMYSRLMMSLYMALTDLKLTNGRWENLRTHSRPAFLHFNGGKDPFYTIDLYDKSSLGSDLSGKWVHLEDGTKLTFHELCSAYLS